MNPSKQQVKRLKFQHLFKNHNLCPHTPHNPYNPHNLIADQTLIQLTRTTISVRIREEFFFTYGTIKNKKKTNYNTINHPNHKNFKLIIAINNQTLTPMIFYIKLVLFKIELIKNLLKIVRN